MIRQRRARQQQEQEQKVVQDDEQQNEQQQQQQKEHTPTQQQHNIILQQQIQQSLCCFWCLCCCCFGNTTSFIVILLYLLSIFVMISVVIIIFVTINNGGLSSTRTSILNGTTNYYYYSTLNEMLLSYTTFYNTNANIAENINNNQYKHFMMNDDNGIDMIDNPNTLPIYIPNNVSCNGYNGIFHISMGDMNGGVGTSLIQLILLQLQYADQYNYIPWIHYTNQYTPNHSQSNVIYDNNIHNNNNISYTFPIVELITNIPYVHAHSIYSKHKQSPEVYPGDPPLSTSSTANDNSISTIYYNANHTGLWNFYFYPVSSFQPNDISCYNKPLLTFSDIYYVIPGLHGYTPKSIMSWRYKYLPEYIIKYHLSYTSWIYPQRIRGYQMVQKYINTRPYLLNYAYQALYGSNHTNNHDNDISSQNKRRKMGNKNNDLCIRTFDDPIGTIPCLGLHIRHSDKAAGRRIVTVSEFYPYVEAFINATKSISQSLSKQSSTSPLAIIYIATDSSIVLNEIRTLWSIEIQSYIRYSPIMIRSINDTAVFDMNDHHRINQEALIDIISLSNCTYLIHGYSALSESSIWFNIHLHNQSINLEDNTNIKSITIYEFYIHVYEMILSTKASQNYDGTIENQHQQQHHHIRPTLFPNNYDQWPLGDDMNRTIMIHSSAINDDRFQNEHNNDNVKDDNILRNQNCYMYHGILHIASSCRATTTSRSFFHTILNQLYYAMKYNLLPFIHLEESSSTTIYDNDISIYDTYNLSHTKTNMTVSILHGMAVSVVNYQEKNQLLYPGIPGMKEKKLQQTNITLTGNGIWNMYFEPIIGNYLLLSNHDDDDSNTNVNQHDNEDCFSKLPMIRMDESLIKPGLESYCPWSIRSYRYDSVPDKLWWNHTSGNSTSLLRHWYEPMRRQAHEIVKKFYKFQPYIIQRANDVHPMSYNNSSKCLGVHIRMNGKDGKYRTKIKADLYGTYMDIYERMGGTCIYLATDSRKAYQYISKNLPQRIINILYSQGQFIVRSSKDIPLHHIEKHHRVNAEVLVDIVALSKCSFLIHGYSTTSEAAIYINLMLHNHSINIEDPTRMSILDFENIIHNWHDGEDLRTKSSETWTESMARQRFVEEMKKTAIIQNQQQQQINHDGKTDDGKDSIEPNSNQEMNLSEPQIIQHQHTHLSDQDDDIKLHICKNNAIVYLVQKKHSTYKERDSYSNFLKSLTLLHKNYLSINQHMNNTDILIFHTGDYNENDLSIIEEHIPIHKNNNDGTIRLINIFNTSYWTRPKSNLDDNPATWYAYPLFPEGYRRMMHWFAIDIWNFFHDWNNQIIFKKTKNSSCNYRYIMRLDEDSYIHSPIQYDIFDMMKSNQYVYGYRMCSYEMKVTQRMSSMWYQRNSNFKAERNIPLDICGFYNNFFVADLHFFWNDNVQKFLSFIDRQGHIYRRRLGDLMIHTMSVYWFAKSNQIHRFLDFTYEHGTISDNDHKSKDIKTYQKDGCLIWGGIQAGYLDTNSSMIIRNYMNQMIKLDCPIDLRLLSWNDLSPSYQHLPSHIIKTNLSLETVTAGQVELSGQGINSG